VPARPHQKALPAYVLEMADGVLPVRGTEAVLTWHDEEDEETNCFSRIRLSLIYQDNFSV